MTTQDQQIEASDFMSNVLAIIDKYNLKAKNRKQAVIYKRYYLYDQLHKAKLSLSHIGLLFNKDHATVIHGLQMHREFTFMKDKIYLHHIQPVINDLTHTPEPVDLATDVLNCNSLEQLSIIKENITRNYY